MAQLSGDINSGTSQWFVNTVNNTTLDGVPHTVFGRVIGDGMEIVDEINDLSKFNLVDTFGVGALTDVPLEDYSVSLTELTGSVSIAAGSDVVTGTGTSFLTEIQGPGSEILIDGNYEIVSIVSDTELIIATQHADGVTNLEASVRTPPTEDQYVLFTDISKILEP